MPHIASNVTYFDKTRFTEAGQLEIELTLAPGEDYFAVTAIDGDGNKSAYSNEVVRQL